MKNRDVKILFVYKEDEKYKTESLWATKRGELYEINNIPFFINNIALKDIVSVEIDEDDLYFENLIKESGNSTIQLVSFTESSQEEIGSKFEKINCSWEGSHLPNYISINIPRETNYLRVRQLLDEGVDQGIWDYKEACISKYHSEK